MRILSRVALCVSMLVMLASCQAFVGAFSAEGNIEAAKMAGPPPGAFDQALQAEYIGIAQTEIDESDYEHGDLFARKGLAAGNGEMVMPEDPANWQLPADKADQFGRARQMLLDALDGGGREKAPAELRSPNTHSGGKAWAPAFAQEHLRTLAPVNNTYLK